VMYLGGYNLYQANLIVEFLTLSIPQVTSYTGP
jgi:hypothetical protein